METNGIKKSISSLNGCLIYGVLTFAAGSAYVSGKAKCATCGWQKFNFFVRWGVLIFFLRWLECLPNKLICPEVELLLCM